MVQVYVSWRNASVPVPQVQLSGLKRGAIMAGTKQTFRFTLTTETFQVWMSDVGFVVESGKYCNSKQVQQNVCLALSLYLCMLHSNI